MRPDTVVTPEKAVETHVPFMAYVIVMKPGIVAMTLIATLCGMYMAGKALPAYGLIFWTLAATGMATAGAAILNNYIDRDIDVIMKRTRGRPLPSGQAPPERILIMGVAFSILSVILSAEFVNFTTSGLLAAAIFCYVILYTRLTKRRTPLATFIGGAGGALPPVIGYAAVKPELDVYALALFLIIFAWQHPHFWSLALKYIDEYRAAGVRNHPVALGVEATKRRIALWAVIMAIVTTAPYFLGMAGWVYLATAVAVGAIHIIMSLAFLMSDRKLAMSIFFFSLVQLPILYSVMLFDIV